MNVVQVQRPDQKILLRCRRTGVESDAGCLLLLPLPIVTGFLWLISDRTWTVEVATDKSGRLVMQPIASSTFETKAEAMNRWAEWTVDARAGLFD